MAPTKSGWTKYGTDQIWLDQKWLRPNMGLEQIWVGPNMGPTKYAGPNLVRPKMADQKCLDQIWLDTMYYHTNFTFLHGCICREKSRLLYLLSVIGSSAQQYMLPSLEKKTKNKTQNLIAKLYMIRFLFEIQWWLVTMLLLLYRQVVFLQFLYQVV